MQISCHNWAFNDLSRTEALGTIARLGFRYVDIGTGAHLKLSSADDKSLLSDLHADLETFKLKVADLTLMLPRISIDDDAKRQQDIDTFRAWLDIAKGLDVAGITVSAGLVHPADDKAAQTRTVESLRTMHTAATEYDLALSIEPQPDSMATTPEQALTLIEAVDGLQLTLDWAYLVYLGLSHADITALLPHTRHIHLRQADKDKLQTTVTNGAIKVAKVVKALQKAKYGGFICVEYTLDELHGAEPVNTIVEVCAMRDAIRDARDG